MATLDDSHSDRDTQFISRCSFSSPEEKKTFLEDFEAARLILAPAKRNANLSVLRGLLKSFLNRTESTPAASGIRTSSNSGSEMMLESAG